MSRKTYVDKRGYYRYRDSDRLVHRQIFRKFHGFLSGNHIVHHKDGNKRNNHPSNLQAMTQEEHEILHGRRLGPIRKALLRSLFLLLLGIIAFSFITHYYGRESTNPTRTQIAPVLNMCTDDYLNTNRPAMMAKCSNECLNKEPVGTFVYQDLDCIPPDKIVCHCKSKSPINTEIAPPQNICTDSYLNTNRPAMMSECSNKCLNTEPIGTLVYQDIDCTPPNTITCHCKSK